MNRLVWLGLIIFITGVKSENFSSVSTSDVESDGSDFYENSSEINFSADFEDLRGENEENSTNYDDMNSYDSPLGYLDEETPINEGNDQGKGSKMDPINSQSSPTSTSLKETTGENEILDYLSSFRQSDNKKNSDNSLLLSSIMRREVNDGQGYQELLESENVPWNYQPYPNHDSYQPDQYYENEMPVDRNAEQFYPQNHYYEIEEPKTNSSQHYGQAAYGSGPHYYQKNYYYNFYVLSSYGKPLMQFDLDELINSHKDENSDGENSKSKCQKYLEFLKFAFEKLDQLPQNDYDDNERYGYGLNTLKSALIPSEPGFTTHLLGPTLYVDNSGKISQTKCQGTNFQNVGESVSQKFTPTGNDFKFEPTEANEPLEPETETGHYSSMNSAPNPTDAIQLHTTPPSDRTTFFTPRNEYQTTFRSGDEIYISPPQNYPKNTFSYTGAVEKSTERYPTTITTKPQTHFPSPFDSRNWGTRFDYYTTRVYETHTGPMVTNPPTVTPFKFRETTDPVRDKKDIDCKDKMLPCPDTINVTYPLNGYCNRYVTCESGMAVRRHCLDGLHFNPITKSCDLPHNSICTYVCPDDDGIYGIPGDCNGYFVCKNSVLEYRMCPPKMHWEIHRRTCVFEEQSSCPMKCIRDEEIKSYYGDCKGYIICLKGIPYYHKCPPNMKFDSMTMSCIPSDMSSCEDDPRLLVKTLNPSILCNRIMRQFGTKLQCDQFSIQPDTTAPYVN